MNLFRINLNLLKAFLVLMQEQQVSLAAKRLNLTQSAISNSLQQLRELFQDELLVRGSKKMVPTKKALHLIPQVEQTLQQLEILFFDTEEFKHKTSTRIFNLGMTDYAEYVLLPKLYDEVKKRAPNISLKTLTYHEFSPESFENGKIELGIGLEKKFPKQLRVERLFRDGPVCVAKANHALFEKPLTLERYLQAEHLTTCVYSEEPARADRALEKLKLKRNIKLTLQNFLPAFQTLADSNLIGTFSKNMVTQFEKKYRLKHVAPPFAIPEFYIAQIWHRHQHNDSGLIWLRTLIRNICQKYFSN